MCRSGGIGRRGRLKICWGVTLVPVRVRPSAPAQMHTALVPSGVTVAHGTLNPLVQVRILARQPEAYALPGSSTVERAAVNR